MGNCPSSSLKELFEEVITDEDKHRTATEHNYGTPDRMVTLIDPRSPLVDAERTPIEVLLKSTACTHEDDETDKVTVDKAQHHKRQLGDPRSISAGILRTPILVESPLQLSSDDTEAKAKDPADVEDTAVEKIPRSAVTDTPVLVCDTSEKIMAVAKKLTFDVSPSPRKSKTAEVPQTAHTRAPLAHVQSNTPSRPRSECLSRRSSSKTKVQGPMSPLQLLHVRQRLAVKRALQLTQDQVENCPPMSVEGTCGGDTQCKPAMQPVKISTTPSLVAKDPTIRF